MRGIILAGGYGKRLWPLTRVVSKQLQAVYDKPLIYYSLSTLIGCGVVEVCVVVRSGTLGMFEGLLGDGSLWGLRIEYREQVGAGGIAEVFGVVGEEFLRNEPVVLVLGDNIFHGDGGQLAYDVGYFERQGESGAMVYGVRVRDPWNYGVVWVNGRGEVLAIEEKPVLAGGGYAVPGFYIYDGEALERSRKLERSGRGELEVTDLHLGYMGDGRLRCRVFAPGVAWFDVGTSDRLWEAAGYVRAIESRSGVKVGCPEYEALKAGHITREQLRDLVASMPDGEYRDFLKELRV